MTEQETISVLRSSGAMENEIPFRLERSLKELKVLISQSTVLGQIPVEDQRIFHFGRELKTNSRSLESFGVGRFGTCLVHVHSAPSQKKPTQLEAPIEMKRAAKQEEVIELLDDSDEDEDDDDCVIVDEVSTARHAKRQRV